MLLLLLLLLLLMVPLFGSLAAANGVPRVIEPDDGVVDGSFDVVVGVGVCVGVTRWLLMASLIMADTHGGVCVGMAMGEFAEPVDVYDEVDEGRCSLSTLIASMCFESAFRQLWHSLGRSFDICVMPVRVLMA